MSAEAPRFWKKRSDGWWLRSSDGTSRAVPEEAITVFPPLVEARAEAERNRRVAGQLARWLDDLDTTGEQPAIWWIQAALDHINAQDGEQ